MSDNNLIARLAKEIAQILNQSDKKKTAPYDTQATIKRVEPKKGIAWVQIPGGIDETPVRLTIDAKEGDSVQVRVSGGRAWIQGNATAPPTDDQTAIAANNRAKKAEKVGVKAAEDAGKALEIAEGTNEHFWHDNTGAHITQVSQDDWNDSTSPNYHSGGNTLITSQGMAIRDGMTELAVFGANGVQIGQSNNGHTIVDEYGMRVYSDSSGDTQLVNLGYGEGNTQNSVANAPYYTFGKRETTAQNYSPNKTYDAGDLCIYNGKVYVCITEIETPEPWEEWHWALSIGNYSIAEGIDNIACGKASHAEGQECKALSYSAHAEGYNCIAYRHAHAEGYKCIADSQTHASSAHAEGERTKALGANAHAGGSNTIAKDYQTVIGQYNIEDNETINWGGISHAKYAFILGNGTNVNGPSNALTVDWYGNVELYLDVDEDASYGTAATSGADKGLFNAIRSLGWYDDVIV